MTSRLIRDAFVNGVSHPVFLHLILSKAFGPEYTGWLFETISTEVQRTFNTSVSDRNRNKIEAIRTCVRTSRAFSAWEIFEKIVVGVHGVTPKWDFVQQPTPVECAVAMVNMSLVAKSATFSEEVHRYCAAILVDYGVIYGPGPLEGSNAYTGRYLDTSARGNVKNIVRRGSVAHQGSLDEALYTQGVKSLAIVSALSQDKKALVAQVHAAYGD